MIDFFFMTMTRLMHDGNDNVRFGMGRIFDSSCCIKRM